MAVWLPYAVPQACFLRGMENGNREEKLDEISLRLFPRGEKEDVSVRGVVCGIGLVWTCAFLLHVRGDMPFRAGERDR